MRQPLTPTETAELNAVLRRAVERMERRRRKGFANDNEVDQIAAAVADLNDELAMDQS